MGPRDDVSSRLLISLREYAAMKLGTETAHETFAAAVRDADCTVARATDPRAWVPLAVLDSVAAAFLDSIGPTLIVDATTWGVPLRREYSAMSLSALTTPDVFYAHLDRARAFYARHLRFEMERKGVGAYRATLHYRDDVPRASNVSCLVARGVLHSVPLLFDLPPADVVEESCFARGADACRYEIRFHRAAPLGLFGAAAGVLVAAIGASLAPNLGWLVSPLAGWIVGRELQLGRRARFMARVTEEQRRLLAEHENEFQRRNDEIGALKEKLEVQRARARESVAPK